MTHISSSGAGEAAISSSDPEGGARGVQTSIATKQESCPESAPRTETTVRDRRKSVFTYEHDDAAGHLYYFAPQTTTPGPYLTQRHVQAIVDIASDGTFAGVELIDNMPPLNSGGADTKSDGGVEGHATASEGASYPEDQANKLASTSPYGSTGEDAPAGPRSGSGIEAAGIKPGPSDQLTKTPSADHDDGNLHGLAAPNHQPHAGSQGWRDDMENAPRGVRFLIAGQYPNGIWYVEESYRHYAGHFNGRKIDPPTHWMPLPAPPSPAKTGTAPSSVEER